MSDIKKISGAAATREELKRLANTTLKDRSGAAVTTPEFERLKKEADNFKLEYGSKKRQNLSNSIKEKITELESYISKKDSKFDVPGVGVSKPEKKSMPKASVGLLVADKLLKGSESARSLTKNLGLTGNLLGNYYDKKASKDVNQKTTTQQVTTKKAGGMTKGQKKIRTVMREFKAKKLKSSSGQKVTNPKQAIAIALSEAGQSKKMKKAKGGAFITKGGDYIKDLL